ncbi:9dc8e501-d636-4b41-b2a8-37bf5485b45f [Thermothielavioides terrestris]|uniref:9dc8e501-d636-4b41-b2a8-37bf5485b45f n=1 Tax=Thermothielavioides terrestris TaxID=2587410 RepID=A0A3S4C8Z6_9PEZI|nr:9dc8e501-d636-4b41-b2a8-37bf5485b45f [Thermothielavioides terrestris]
MASEADPSSLSEYVGYRLTIFVCVFIPLQILAVALRFWARSITRGSSYGLDDWLVLVSLLCQLVACGIAIGSIKQAGAGYHVAYLEETSPETVVSFFKYLVAISAWYTSTVSLGKLAICCFYRRLFPQKPVLIVVGATAAVLIGNSIASTIVILAACKPFSANWGPVEVQATHCINKEALFVWATLPNILTDAVLLAVPIPIVLRLHASNGLKVGLLATFLFGSIGLIASILRFVAFHNTNSFTDATFNAAELIIWTVCEPGIYLIAACLMVYRPLLEKFHIISPSGSKSGTGPGQSGGVSAHHVSSTSRSRGLGYLAEASARGIPLRSKDGNGRFESLEDRASDEHPFKHSGAITETTSVQLSWEHVPPGTRPYGAAAWEP